MKKISAVEWLIEQFNNYDLNYGKANFRLKLKQAKEMEKEQIEDAYIACWENDGGNGNHKVIEAEQYFNETYK